MPASPSPQLTAGHVPGQRARSRGGGAPAYEHGQAPNVPPPVGRGSQLQHGVGPVTPLKRQVKSTGDMFSPGFKLCLCPSPVVRPWARCLPAPSLRLLLCKMRKTISLGGGKENKFDKAHSLLLPGS